VHVLTMKLRNAGYDVVTAGDGEEGLEVAFSEKPDLIITDYQMPCVDGLEMCRGYRDRAHREVPAIMITAREFDLDSTLLTDTGVAEVLPKPFSPRHVLMTIERLLCLGGVTSDVARPTTQA
jgi:two-component system alkaline phosphatase synthesis response regulator PhoP